MHGCRRCMLHSACQMPQTIHTSQDSRDNSMHTDPDIAMITTTRHSPDVHKAGDAGPSQGAVAVPCLLLA